MNVARTREALGGRRLAEQMLAPLLASGTAAVPRVLAHAYDQVL
jgi:hypothetical protein